MSRSSPHIPNATAIDSDVYSDIFGTSAMREVWSDRSRIQYYLDFEKALALTQAYLGVIPREAAEEISVHCNVGRDGLREVEDNNRAYRLPCATSRSAVNCALQR